ncbi:MULTISPECIES: 7TM diverse intracellular signaling domain-containing protein [Flammeovirga]|uniref:HTH luxR-type domain-containing protein n=1 Tax=Flammeovirga agarivorans TaxID=2726742 RepID=A0A7X8SQ91_9BACT|nr:MULTISPECIES: 7TM diverse intracellular signaling domain-containing protein [Flammeovirga]NLR94392.1 hypothetical protein [Flammeovirga agarivorans]
MNYSHLFIFLLFAFSSLGAKNSKLSLSYIWDRNNSIQISTIDEVPFNDVPGHQINLSYSPTPVWIKAEIESDEVRREFLKFNKTLVDSLTFYHYDANNQLVSQLGGVKVDNSETNASGFYFPITLHKGSNVFYFRAKNNYSHIYGITLVDHIEIEKTEFIQITKYGILLGIFIVMVLYNVFLSVNLKDSIYGYYALHAFFVLLGALSLEGFFTLKYLNIPAVLLPHIIAVSVCTVSVISCVFCIKFLKLKQTSKLYYMIMRTVMIVDIVIFVFVCTLQAIGFDITYKFLTIMTTVYCFFALATGVKSVQQGNSVAKFYLLGWTVYFLGIISQALIFYGILVQNIVTQNFYLFAIVTEVLLMSFALADRYRQIKIEKKKLSQTLATKQDDLDVVILDNKRRHTVHQNVMLQLKEILNNKENIEKEVRSMVMDLSHQNISDEKQLHFQDNISEVDTFFIKKLKTMHPNLTPAELEICSLLKLNYSTKEIASFRSTSEGAVKVNKSRIKKKLGLETTLNDYIITV